MSSPIRNSHCACALFSIYYLFSFLIKVFKISRKKIMNSNVISVYKESLGRFLLKDEPVVLI